MIHPHTELRWVDDDVGFGVFATEDLPIGTILYVRDPLEIELDAHDPRLRDPMLTEAIQRYSYTDASGVRILSWDHAKYVNHSCQPNCLRSSYGFDVVIRPIAAGEKITDDHGLFNLETPLAHDSCGDACRGEVRGDDLDHHGERWDQELAAALPLVSSVPQPLWRLLPTALKEQLVRDIDRDRYPSVRRLRVVPAHEQSDDERILFI